ncbi:MAG TPA: chloride channel protein [Sphingomicrobium sp.]|jgi:H+/Cl- antiporter ClcA
MANRNFIQFSKTLSRWFVYRRLRTTVPVARRRVATTAGAILLAVVALAFARTADAAQLVFDRLVDEAPGAPLILTPAVFAAVAFATLRWARAASGSGIPQIIAAAAKPKSVETRRLANFRTALSKLILTLLMLLGGASVGREGPTVQVSAAVMVWVHRLLRVPITAGVLIAGGAAGVAAAFNTPLAGVAFAIEELAAAYEQRVALLVMAAVMISGLTMIGVAGDYVYFGVLRTSIGLRQTIVLAPAVGIAGGIAGGLFSRIVLHFANAKTGWAPRLKRRPVLFAAGCGFIVALAGIMSGGTTWGTGYAPARALIEGGRLTVWFGPAKFVASIFTTLSGTPGGIFSPSLAVGAGLGNAMAGLFPGSPPSAIALLGMAAYFVGVVRAPLTAVIILMETTASRGMILPLFATALIADATSGLVSRERIYHGLARGFGAAVEEANKSPPGPSS